jgi:hypothetical protein
MTVVLHGSTRKLREEAFHPHSNRPEERKQEGGGGVRGWCWKTMGYVYERRRVKDVDDLDWDMK